MEMWNQWTKMDMESIELENIHVLVEKIYNHGTHIDPGTHTHRARGVYRTGDAHGVRRQTRSWGHRWNQGMLTNHRQT